MEIRASILMIMVTIVKENNQDGVWFVEIGASILLVMIGIRI